MKKYFQISKGKIIFSLMALVLFVFPLIRLILLSLTKEDGSFSLDQYYYFLSDSRALESVINTLQISISASLISALCGIITAFLVGYTNIKYKNLIEALVLMPFVIPAYVTTLAWTGLTGPGSVLSQYLAAHMIPGIDLFTIHGIIGMLGICHMSVVHVTVVHMLRKVPQEVGWAARASGCSQWKTLLKVDLPMVMPAIAGGTVLAFLADVDNFAIPAFLGISSNIPVLSTYIYEKIIGFGPNSFTYGAVLSVVLSLVALSGALLSTLLVHERSYQESAKENFNIRIWFSPPVRRVIEIGTVSLLTIFSIVPLVYMAITALLRGFTFSLDAECLTLDNYIFVFTNDGVREAVINSLFMAGTASVICLILGTLIAYMSVRKQSKVASFLNQCASVMYSVPGIVLALALIFYWSQPIPGLNTGLYGTFTIIILGYITRYMIIQIRNSSAAFLAVAEAAEQAALASGSNSITLWVKIIMPQIAIPALAGTFFIFLSALTELTMSSIMASASTKTIGLQIFNLQQAGDYSLAAALSAVIVLFMGIIYGLQKLIRLLLARRKTYESDN
ncbi:MAG: iron ABC transporter permease [Acidaminococcaceae bacterium]|nr:iron ABC transporter permease [Acidaminococcaceae bacterium]